MIIEKDGQIIVTELRPMSEIKDIYETLLFVISGENGDFWFDMASLDFVIRAKAYAIGWLPLPIYRPEQVNGEVINEKLMKNNKTVVIKKVGNGYLLYPFGDDEYASKEQFVFQEKGFVSSSNDGVDTQNCLFGFLDKHFSDTSN